MSRFPLNHHTWSEVQERERLIREWLIRDFKNGAKYRRMRELIAETPSGCMNYLRPIIVEPPAAA